MAISGFPNHKIANYIRLVLILRKSYLVRIYGDICAGYSDVINRACNPQKNQPVFRRA